MELVCRAVGLSGPHLAAQPPHWPRSRLPLERGWRRPRRNPLATARSRHRLCSRPLSGRGWLRPQRPCCATPRPGSPRWHPRTSATPPWPRPRHALGGVFDAVPRGWGVVPPAWGVVLRGQDKVLRVHQRLLGRGPWHPQQQLLGSCPWRRHQRRLTGCAVQRRKRRFSSTPCWGSTAAPACPLLPHLRRPLHALSARPLHTPHTLRAQLRLSLPHHPRACRPPWSAALRCWWPCCGRLHMRHPCTGEHPAPVPVQEVEAWECRGMCGKHGGHLGEGASLHK